MGIKYLNLEIKLYRKKYLLLLIIFTNILSIYSSNHFLTYSNKIENNRNIQFTSKSIYYIIPYPKNNITGTGDIMEDSAFKALCKILSCDSGCCVGKIDSIRCGEKAICDVYNDYVTARIVVPAVIVPIVVVLFLILMILIFMKRNEYSLMKSVFLAFLCLFVITIPCVLFYARKKANNSDIKNLNKKQK